MQAFHLFDRFRPEPDADHSRHPGPHLSASLAPLPRAMWLDVLAGIELQHGHHQTAERLSRLAQTMRTEVAQ